MPKVDIDTLIGMLSEYEVGDLNEYGKMHLKDELLDLSEQLHNEEVEEGWKYDSMMLIFKEGDTLPQPYRGMNFKSPLTDNEHTIKIKEITGLRKNKNGDLIVEALVRKFKDKKG